MKPTLLVLAAGMGSRYGGLKQLDQVGPSGETIIDYSVYDAIRAGFGKVVFIIRKQIEKEFIEFFGNRFGDRIKVDYVFQETNILPEGAIFNPERTKPWGTGHAVLMAKDKIQEPFAVINADDFYGAEAFKKIADFLNQKQSGGIPEYALAGYILSNTLSEFGGVSRGVCEISEDGYLQNVVETKNIHNTHNHIAFSHENGELEFIPADTIVSMNTWAFWPEIFNEIETSFKEFILKEGDNLKSEFYIPTIADQMIKSGKARFKVLPVSEKWFGVTYQEDKPTVVESLAQLVKAGIYPHNLWV
jgi:NDP-sugar pyrophosphorylase family protein